MNRFSRINTIWRKELVDTLRDRRTLVAMVLVPIVLYPALMLGSLQAFEVQAGRLKQETYDVAVPNEMVAGWLRRIIDTDPSRLAYSADLPAEDLPAARDAAREDPPEDPGADIVVGDGGAREEVEQQARRAPPEYRVNVVADVIDAVTTGEHHAGLMLGDQPVPDYGLNRSVRIGLIFDETEIRSQIAANGLQAILQRFNDALLAERIEQLELPPDVLEPLAVLSQSVATAEKVGGSILGQIVPLILIVMTITGAIYPAIDLTAGERERGTLETLMVAPVPTVDLIAGKFIVVALIGMLSATLNLLSVGGTIYLGGFGQLLSQGGDVIFPLHAIPWTLVVLVPLAVMFSALLLAVCSFARSFKEAQNYIMPVMVAALIPAVIGSLPGTRLEGPLLVMPVTNIVVLTRDLFVGRVEFENILGVTVSTSLYALAAVAVAAKLFGQEAVLFADSGSIKTLFIRRFFKPRPVATASLALLITAVAYLAHFFVSQSVLNWAWFQGSMRYFGGLAVLLTVLLAVVPLLVCYYARVRPQTAFGLLRPHPAGIVAGVLIGSATWLLAGAWIQVQQTFLPMPPELLAEFERVLSVLEGASPWLVIFLLAVVPGLIEEFFFRGFLLNGLRSSLGPLTAVLIAAFAFAMFHHSAHRLVLTGVLGVLFGLLVIRSGSVVPAMLAHVLHNGLSVAKEKLPQLQTLLIEWHVIDAEGYPADPRWLLVAGALLVAGVVICLRLRPQPISEVTLERLDRPEAVF